MKEKILKGASAERQAWESLKEVMTGFSNGAYPGRFKFWHDIRKKNGTCICHLTGMHLTEKGLQEGSEAIKKLGPAPQVFSRLQKDLLESYYDNSKEHMIKTHPTHFQ